MRLPRLYLFLVPVMYLAMLSASAGHVFAQVRFVPCASHVFGLAMLSALTGYVHLFLVPVMYSAWLCYLL